MQSALKKGTAGFFVLVLFFIIISGIVLYQNRRYLYMAYENGGMAMGINLNNIADPKYVDFIKSQDPKKDIEQKSIYLNQAFKYQAPEDRETQILGDSTADPNKKIEVDISEQKLYLKDGDKTVGSFLVSTGKWAPTPIGEWPIWIKLRYTRMSGGSKALDTYYNLPNVPYTMYFNQGYGIHGAYWHNNFGQPMSHGCINMRPEEAGIVYNWASVGTKVIVHN